MFSIWLQTNVNAIFVFFRDSLWLPFIAQVNCIRCRMQKSQTIYEPTKYASQMPHPKSNMLSQQRHCHSHHKVDNWLSRFIPVVCCNCEEIDCTVVSWMEVEWKWTEFWRKSGQLWNLRSSLVERLMKRWRKSNESKVLTNWIHPNAIYRSTQTKLSFSLFKALYSVCASAACCTELKWFKHWGSYDPALFNNELRIAGAE